MQIPDKNKQEAPVIYINDKSVKNGKIALSLNAFKKLKLTLSKGNVSNFKLKIPGVKTEFIKGNRITATTLKNIESINKGDNIVLFDIKNDTNEKLAPVIIELVE